MAIKAICVGEMEFDVSYILSRGDSSKWILFLHGWGANKELMQGCFDKRFIGFNRLYIDLPGFGNSSNPYILTSSDYAMILRTFLAVLGINPHIIVGHSFGGKVALLLNPAVLVLLSSAGIPKIKNIQVKIKIKLAKMCKIFGIKNTMFRSKDALNMPENMYATFKNIVDEDFSDNFCTFGGKAFIFWGEDDDITPLYMAERIHSLIRDSELYVLKGDHFFFLNNVDTIYRIIHGQ